MDIILLLLVLDDEFHDFSLEIITIVLIYFVWFFKKYIIEIWKVFVSRDYKIKTFYKHSEFNCSFLKSFLFT